MPRRGGLEGPQGQPVRGWERWVNPGDFREVNGMASVWHASGICPDALRAGGALTLGGESGLVHFLSAELDPITNDSDDTNANVSISIAQLSPSSFVITKAI